MRTSLDPLRYGVRALEEMARELASVAPPAQVRNTELTPHPLLRSPSRDGAALSLRLFSEADDDATALVLGEATTKTFAPIPPRAASFFEAHAAAIAAELESSITVGFPLATFVQQGATRAAPLFSRGGARARWKLGDAAWKLPAGARPGASLPVPDALVLELGAADDAYTVHAGVWHFLFGLDAEALTTIAAAGAGGIGALVRAASRVLEAGGVDEGIELEPPRTGPLTREDLAVLGDAATRRAQSSRALKCHPHGLAMIPPRGDPTSGLRLDLHAVVGETLPPRGPLAVYLGAPAARPRSAPIFTSGKVPPTPSQLAAARAFEGSEDIVAVCGPPGCGKTALLHHVAAQTVLDCALGKLWSEGTPARGAAWPLVVTSTNNAAVDHALAPFVSGPGLPVGIRLGNRRALAEATAVALSFAMEWLEAPPTASLADARAAFEARAAPLRAFQKERASAEKERAASEPEAPALDTELYDLAIAVRDAWAKKHRLALVQRLAAARDAVRAEWSDARGKPLPMALRELAALFPVAGCTLLSMRASFPLGSGVIDRLVIDEAAQCAPIYAVPALARARRAMLTGDVAQLPPVYTLAPHVDERLAKGLDAAALAPFRMSAESTASAQAVAEPRARARLSLTEHFRSQPEIVALASRWSGYALDVRTPPRSLAAVAPRLDAAVMAFAVPGTGARAPEGIVNEAEAERALELASALVASGVAPSDIAVLTPFVGQGIRIERELAARQLAGSGGVLVSTVHRLQGGERRVVIFSVTATERRHLRWLGERPHLLHVATSRAQDHLVVLVDPDAASREPALLPLRELLV